LKDGGEFIQLYSNTLRWFYQRDHIDGHWFPKPCYNGALEPAEMQGFSSEDPAATNQIQARRWADENYCFVCGK